MRASGAGEKDLRQLLRAVSSLKLKMENMNRVRSLNLLISAHAHIQIDGTFESELQNINMTVVAQMEKKVYTLHLIVMSNTDA